MHIYIYNYKEFSREKTLRLLDTIPCHFRYLTKRKVCLTSRLLPSKMKFSNMFYLRRKEGADLFQISSILRCPQPKREEKLQMSELFPLKLYSLILMLQIVLVCGSPIIYVMVI